uniref:Uncharacterized protein n=1 Tax=Knipowitschia caucasica TaxID=637954 RepID=A0AAV2JSH8_KNICA
MGELMPRGEVGVDWVNSAEVMRLHDSVDHCIKPELSHWPESALMDAGDAAVYVTGTTHRHIHSKTLTTLQSTFYNTATP